MYLPKMCAIVVVCGLLGNACAVKTVASKALKPSKKTRVELHCTPKIAIGTAFGPVTFMSFLRVKNPGEKFWCPAVQWYVGEMKLGGHESDCDPYESVVVEQGKEPEVWSEPVKYFALLGGEHTITAKLTRAGRVIAHANCKVVAR